MAVISLPVSPLIEEFFNKNHSRADGKFTSGGGGSGKTTTTVGRSAKGKRDSHVPTDLRAGHRVVQATREQHGRSAERRATAEWLKNSPEGRKTVANLHGKGLKTGHENVGPGKRTTDVKWSMQEGRNKRGTAEWLKNDPKGQAAAKHLTDKGMKTGFEKYKAGATGTKGSDLRSGSSTSEGRRTVMADLNKVSAARANARLAPAAAVGTTRDGKFVSPGQLAHEKQKAGGTLTAHEGQMARAHQGLQPGVIRDGKVHVDGVAVTTRIGKQGSDIWHAKMTAKHGGGDVSGNTRAELGRNVTEHIAERAAQGRVGMKKAGLATTTQRDSDGARLNRMSATHAEKLSGIGAARIGDVSVGRGGTVKVKGKETDFTVSKGSHSKTFKSGYHVSGISDNRGYPKFFSTQAAAKREIAKNVSLAAGI